MYWGIFPEGYLIKRMRLIRLWIAIEAKEERTLEEVAREYLNELLNRNLMQVAGRTTDRRVKFYYIHDLLREMIILKSKDQNFPATVKEQTTMWPERVRRLSVHTSFSNIQHIWLFLKWSRLRDDPLVHLENLPNLVHLELLQVYDGDTLCFKVGKFKKLKLLGLDKFDKLKCVQVEKGAMPSLEKLVIHRCSMLWGVPFGIEHLCELKVFKFFDMLDELIMKLRPDGNGEDLWKVKHVPEVYSAYWRDGGWDIYSIDSFGERESKKTPGKARRSHDLRTLWKPVEIDVVSCLRLVLLASIAFSEHIVKPASSTSFTLSLLSQLHHMFEIDRLEIQFNQSDCKFIIVNSQRNLGAMADGHQDYIPVPVTVASKGHVVDSGTGN
ncbi:hypothetical protein FEM48_Zijuj11G0132800 [Ziziphus jujuba var. spinosa]|uniref:Disease resistance protein winged helix domain-containing protein n=1 Tax=Ziziphus jujuba var. spinosa TaxID=714518 RepID=A0A978UJ56_ZIZJJ|nr:hypothetical protein FEM48_Zijuj11G0132800 [Ziziphus jujuba var. spinosa]